MVQMEVENDGFRVGEVLTGPDDCQIVLDQGHVRFILVMKRPERPTRGDVVAELLLKIEDAEKDADELAYPRCLDDIREFVISACKDTIYKLAASVQKPEDSKQSLEDWLHPTTFYLQLCTMEGHVTALVIDDTSEYACMHEPVCFPMDCIQRSVHTLIPARELDFIEDLFMGKVLKVSHNGKTCVFKSATWGNEDQLKREIDILQQISEDRELHHSKRRLFIPRLLGLVTSNNQLAGILEEFIGASSGNSGDLRIEETVAQLHQNNIVWGDVKPANILIDNAKRPWLIDFGGSSTDGWVDDDDLAETIEGDLQGLRRLVQFLGFEQ